MNKLPATALFFLLVFPAFSQNVGIGNTTPHTKLEVTGAISSTPVSAPAAATVVIPDNVSIFHLTAVAGTQANALSVATPQEGQYLTIYNEDNDSATFAGYAVAASGGIASFSYISTGWRMLSNSNTASDTGSYIRNQTSTDQSSGFRITGNGLFNGGRVGIGTTAPLSALDIAGGMALGSYAGSTAAPANSLIVSGDLGVGISTPTNPMEVAIPAYSSQVQDQSFIYGTGNRASSNGDIGEAFTAGITGLMSELDIYPDYPVGSGTYTLHIYQGDGYGGTLLASQVYNFLNPISTLTLSSPPLLISGQVYTWRISLVGSYFGFEDGTTTLPAGKHAWIDFGPDYSFNFVFHEYVEPLYSQDVLKVTSAGGIQAHSLIGTGSRVVFADTAGNLSAGATSYSSVPNIYTSDGTLSANRTVTMGADNLTFGSTTGNLIFNPSSTGNVGVGNASPGYLLHVGNSTRSSASYITVDAAAAQATALQFSSAGSQAWVMYRPGNSTDLRFYNSGADRITFQNGGNVGIGNANPSSLLYVGGGSVAGSVLSGINVALGGNSYVTASDGTRTAFIGADNSGYAMVGSLTNSDFVIRSDNAERIRVVSSGNVGIGTSSPTQGRLVVSGISSGGNVNVGNYYYYAIGGNGNSNGTIDISIYATNRMVASEFDATSDRRIKKDLVPSEGSCDLGTLSALRVTDFKYIDAASNGRDYKKGFIAQEVEKVFPEAVQRHKDFIPSVYALSADAEYISATRELKVTMSNPHGLAAGDMIRIFTADNTEKNLTVVSVTGDRQFTVNDWAEADTRSVFVYGKQVDDFRTVDYDRIYTLNVSATQELTRQLSGANTEIEKLKEENASLKSSKAESSDLQQIKASVETLQQLIGSKAER